MRGEDQQPGALFSYVSLEERIPASHPLRAIRRLTDQILAELSPHLAMLYSTTGRPSIAPEKLLRALLLQAFYTIRSERQLMEQLDYNLLFRWFVGLSVDDRIWDVTVYTKNRDRLLEGDIATEFFRQVVAQARAAHLTSDEHFTVDGTLLEAWASHKSFVVKSATASSASDSDPKTPAPPTASSGDPDAGNPMVDFRKEKRSNDTHQSTTDPESRLYKKSQGSEAKLAYLGHIVTENRNGLVVNACVTQATGTAEREAALAMARQLPGGTRRVTLGADKGYDAADFVEQLRELAVTPHVAQNTSRRRSAIDERTTRHEGYAISQRKRKRVEEVFGWLKTVGTMHKLRHRGRAKVEWVFTLAVSAYNLVRITRLLAQTA